eukprot:299113_1
MYSPVWSLPSSCDFASTISLSFQIQASIEHFYLDNVCLTADFIIPTSPPTKYPTLLPTLPTTNPSNIPTGSPTITTIAPTMSPTSTVWCDDMSDYSATGWTGSYLSTSTDTVNCANQPCLYVYDSHQLSLN